MDDVANLTKAQREGVDEHGHALSRRLNVFSGATKSGDHVGFLSLSVRPEAELDTLSAVLRSFPVRGSTCTSWELKPPWAISFAQGSNAPFHFVQYGACVLITNEGKHSAQFRRGRGARHCRQQTTETPVRAANQWDV